MFAPCDWHHRWLLSGVCMLVSASLGMQMALPAGTILVEFVRYAHWQQQSKSENRYGAVILAPPAKPRWMALGAAEGIEAEIRLYQKAVRGETNETVLEQVLRGLYGKLWAPIEAALPEGRTPVILSPDGELNFVSFATLLGPDGEFVAQRRSVRYVASGRDLLRKTAKPADLRIALYGDPNFLAAGKGRAATAEPASRSSAEFPGFETLSFGPLPGTAAECKGLATWATEKMWKAEVKTGAQNLLLTLWPINDNATVQIMLDFYERASKTSEAPQVLADAQRDWLLKLRKERGLAKALQFAGPFIMSLQGAEK